MTTVRRIMCGFGALAALSIVPGALPGSYAEARAYPVYLEPVSNCVVLLDLMRLQNQCDFTVQVTWCVENYDCRNGEFARQFNLGADGILDVGGTSGSTVHWGACRGSNSLTTVGTQPYSWTFRCV